MAEHLDGLWLTKIAIEQVSPAAQYRARGQVSHTRFWEVDKVKHALRVEALRLSEQHVGSKPQLLAGQTPGACRPRACRLACSSPMSWQRARDAL